MVAPALDKIAQEYAGRVLVAKVNTDEDSEWAERYHVRGIPTMVFISGGQLIHQPVGVVSYTALRQMVII